MKFCPKCGSVLRTQRRSTGLVYLCSKCGYEEVLEKAQTAPSTLNRTDRVHPRQPIIVDGEDSDKTSLPKTKAVCPKCGNGEAYWWMQQTRSADEATTRFFRCTKCGHVWREYD